MPTATITGPVYGVSQVYDFISMSVVFELSRWEADAVGLISSGPLIVPVDDNGNFSVNLTLNTSGETVYQCFIQYRRTDGTEWIREPIGIFTLTSEGTSKLSDLEIIPLEDKVPSLLDVYAYVLSEKSAVSANKDLAKQWASEDEDVVVADGLYSALHYRNKTQALFDQIDYVQGNTFEFKFSATQDQTVFTGADALGAVLNIKGNCRVFIEGQYIDSSQYTISGDGLSLTLNNSATAGDQVIISAVTSDLTQTNYNYPELTTASIIKPNGHIWSINAFKGAQANLLAQEENRDWVNTFNEALNSGEKIDVPSGNYPFRSVLDSGYMIQVAGDTPVDVICSRNANLQFKETIEWFNGGLFKVLPMSTPNHEKNIPFSWKGGVFDGSSLIPTSERGVGFFDIYQLTNYLFEDVTFFAGIDKNDYQGVASIYGNIDTAITTHNCLGGMKRNCKFVGMFDAGSYLSGDKQINSWDVTGQNETEESCMYYRCGNAGIVKRNHRGARFLHAYVNECGNGFRSGIVDSDYTTSGDAILIDGCIIIRTIGRPIYLDSGRDSIVINNIIEDFGVQAKSNALTSVSINNQISGIDLRGTKDAHIRGNTIRLKDWKGLTQSSGKELIGIRLRDNEGGTSGCVNAQVTSNTIEEVMRPILEDGSLGSRNKVLDNEEIDATSGSSYDSVVRAGSVTDTVYRKAPKYFEYTVDPASLDPDTTISYTVAASGVKRGDQVTWSYGNRGGADVAVDAILVVAVADTDIITLTLRNVASLAADLSNTVFQFEVR